MKQIKHTNIVFKSANDVDNLNDLNEDKIKKQINTYYQICQFKNKFTKKYETRKIVFDELGKILKIYEKEYNYEELSIFMKHHRENKYKIYSVYSIQDVELPTTTDIICCQSELLNNDIVDNINNNMNNYLEYDKMKENGLSNKFLK